MPRPKKKRGHGGGTVTKVGAKFRARVARVVGGETVRESQTFATREEAEDWIAGRQAAADAGSLTTGTFGEWAAAWLQQQRAVVAPSGFRRDEQVLVNNVVPHLGAVRLADFDANVVNRWLAALRAGGATDTTLAAAWQVLRKCLRAHANLPNSRWEKVKVPTVRRPEQRALSQAEYQRLVAAAAGFRQRWPFLEALVRVQVECCARPREVLALRRGDYAGGVMSLRQALCPVSGGPKALKTEKSRRDVPLSAGTIAVVESWLAVHAGESAESPLFRPARGDGYLDLDNFTARVFRPLVAAAGLADSGVHPYTLRHTGASLLLSAALPIRVVASRLGHADTSLVLRTYAHVMPGDQKTLTGYFDGLDQSVS